MWSYGHDFNIGIIALEYGMEAEFNESSCFVHNDYNLIEGNLGYAKKVRCMW